MMGELIITHLWSTFVIHEPPGWWSNCRCTNIHYDDIQYKKSSRKISSCALGAVATVRYIMVNITFKEFEENIILRAHDIVCHKCCQRSFWNDTEKQNKFSTQKKDKNTEKNILYFTSDSKISEEQPSTNKWFFSSTRYFLHDVDLWRIETKSGCWWSVSHQVHPQ